MSLGNGSNVTKEKRNQYHCKNNLKMRIKIVIYSLNMAQFKESRRKLNMGILKGKNIIFLDLEKW